MSATSPLTIMVYVILVMLLASTILRHLTKEKFIVALLRSSLQHRKQVIGSYRRTAKMYKILIVAYCVLIPLLIYLYFNREQGEWILLVVAGILALMLIKAIEDINYRNTVAARLEAELPTIRHVAAAHVSEEVFEARMRKWRKIAVAVSLMCMVAVLVAFYCTMGGPWWFYFVAAILMISAVALGSWLTYRQE